MRDVRQIERRPFPLGDLRRKPHVVVVRMSNRPRLITLNRYPGQVIGFVLRLPPEHDGGQGHLGLSVMWAKPARWWK